MKHQTSSIKIQNKSKLQISKAQLFEVGIWDFGFVWMLGV